MIWLKVGLPIAAYVVLVVINYGLFTALQYKFLHTLQIIGWGKDKGHFIAFALTGPIGLIISVAETLQRYRYKPYFMWKRKPIIRPQQEQRLMFIRLDAEGRGYWTNADMSPEEEIASKMEWVQE